MKLLHKTTSLNELDYSGLLKEVISEISMILYDKVENWNNRESNYTTINEIYDKLLLNANNEDKLISVALSDFNKGYKNRDTDLLENAQKINTYLLEKQRFKGYSGRARALSGTLALVVAIIMSISNYPKTKVLENFMDSELLWAAW